MPRGVKGSGKESAEKKEVQKKMCIRDSAWGWEPVTVDIIKQYRPATSSISSGQVLHCPYDFDKGRLIVREMTELLALDLVRKRVVTRQIVLDVGYDRESLTGDRGKLYTGPVVTDHYGRKVPKYAHGTGNIDHYTSCLLYTSSASCCTETTTVLTATGTSS